MNLWTARYILDSIDEGKLRLDMAKAEAEAAAQQRQDEETASNDAAWDPIIARIKESIPEWAWEHIRYCNRKPTYRSEHMTMIVPAVIDLGDMGQVGAYWQHNRWDHAVMFTPAEWQLVSDDETWFVKPSNLRSESEYSIPGTPDFLIALAAAYENAHVIPELRSEADRRNAPQQATENPTPLPVDWLSEAIRAIGVGLGDGNQDAIGFALIGILEQLQKITTPLYGGTQHAIQTFDNSRCQL